jgi:phage shock protein A
MKPAVMATLWMIAAAPSVATAQPPAPSISHPSARDGLDEQLGEVTARIDRREARHELSAEDAKHARLEVNDLQAQVADARARDGGRLSEADRFALQGEIHRLEDRIDQERPAGSSPS